MVRGRSQSRFCFCWTISRITPDFSYHSQGGKRFSRTHVFIGVLERVGVHRQAVDSAVALITKLFENALHPRNLLVKIYHILRTEPATICRYVALMHARGRLLYGASELCGRMAHRA